MSMIPRVSYTLFNDHCQGVTFEDLGGGGGGGGGGGKGGGGGGGGLHPMHSFHSARSRLTRKKLTGLAASKQPPLLLNSCPPPQ